MSSPIPGTAKRRHLASNLRALELTIPADVLAELNSMEAAGDRASSRSPVNGQND